MRSSRSTVCRENYLTSPDKGFCDWQNSVYYGYKLHAVCTTDGIFTDFDVTQDSVHDIHYLKDIKQLYQKCTILVDKGDLSIDYKI
ncbi:transposase, partial [Elizabethkingia argenteiflava]|uniref:transposase n=1 Tax=Elizabethkingia argenteiflava TaxID=2681556 RepID=UPI003742B903